MGENLYGDLSVIGMKGCEDFVAQVDSYLRDWRRHDDDSKFIIEADCPRFGSGEAKGIVHESLRGHDVYIICDMFNYGVTYKMYGMTVPMSPDDHFQDLKRVIGAIAGKARRISVIMPMLYEGRQHKRSSRESLDCAVALQELVNMGVENIITFDAHDARVQNAIPLNGFDNVRPTYQMIKALVRNVPDVSLDRDDIMIVSPDEGGMSRCMYYSSVLKLDLGMFYKRRDYSKIVDGRNPIVAHEYLGVPVEGKDVFVSDDIISSGDSVLDIAQNVKSRNAKRFFAYATYAIFTNGLEKFDKAYEEGLIDGIFGSNLTYVSPELKNRPWFHEVDVSKYIAYYISALNHDASIGAMIDPHSKIDALLRKRAEEKIEK